MNEDGDDFGGLGISRAFFISELDILLLSLKVFIRTITWSWFPRTIVHRREPHLAGDDRPTPPDEGWEWPPTDFVSCDAEIFSSPTANHVRHGHPRDQQSREAKPFTRRPSCRPLRSWCQCRSSARPSSISGQRRIPASLERRTWITIHRPAKSSHNRNQKNHH